MNQYLIYNQIIESDLKFTAFQTSGNTDIWIRNSKFNLPKSYKTKIFRNEINAKYAQNGNKHYLIWENAIAFEIDEAKIHYMILGNIPMGLVEVFLLSEALGICFFLKGKVLFHGGAVALGSVTKVFLGKPGTGKSSTVAAYALAGATVLADDMVVIDFDSSTYPLILPSHLPIKIWENTVVNLGQKVIGLQPAWEGKNKYYLEKKEKIEKEEIFKLKEINILQKPFSKKNSEINFQQAHLELSAYFPLAHQLLSGEKLKDYFKKMGQIIQFTHIRNLNRPKTFEHLKRMVNDDIYRKL